MQHEAEHILYEGDTRYDHYAVIERTYEGRPARVLFSGSRRAAQSGIGLDDDPDLLFDYNQRLLELANAVYPKNVLIIGGGAYTLPMALQAALPDAELEVVELDKGLQPIAEAYFGLQASGRLKLLFGDGRQYLQTAEPKYDLIILDVFSDLTVPKQFLTSEFVALLYNKLRPGGVTAMNIIASLVGRNAGLIKSQVAAYSRLFDEFAIYPAAHGLTGWLPQNLVLVAQKSPVQEVAPYIRYAAVELPKASEEDMHHDNEVANI